MNPNTGEYPRTYVFAHKDVNTALAGEVINAYRSFYDVREQVNKLVFDVTENSSSAISTLMERAGDHKHLLILDREVLSILSELGVNINVHNIMMLDSQAGPSSVAHVTRFILANIIGVENVLPSIRKSSSSQATEETTDSLTEEEEGSQELKSQAS